MNGKIAYSPKLLKIDGSAEVIPFCRANVYEKTMNGDYEYTGGTDVSWDDQYQMKVRMLPGLGLSGMYENFVNQLGADEDEGLWMDDGGYTWPESSLIYLSKEGLETLSRMLEYERAELAGRVPIVLIEEVMTTKIVITVKEAR